jgi:hypothetical protein
VKSLREQTKSFNGSRDKEGEEEVDLSRANSVILSVENVDRTPTPSGNNKSQ